MPSRKRSTARYYAECTKISVLFLSQHQKAWQVFDRDKLDEQGGVLPICLCINRAASFNIRDALNEAEATEFGFTK